MGETFPNYVAFAGHTRIARGSLPKVAREVRSLLDRGETVPIAVFDGSTGSPVDLDLRGNPDEVAARVEERLRTEAAEASRKAGPGRPRLGVVGREVTLLPRHWDWLAAQPGGASVTLRKLVEAARKGTQGAGRVRRAQDHAYRFMAALAGDLPGFEEAIRALYAWDLERFGTLMQAWPADVRDQAMALVEAGRKISPGS